MAWWNMRAWIAWIVGCLPLCALAQYDPGATYQIATNNVAFTQSVLMTNELARVGQLAYGDNAATTASQPRRVSPPLPRSSLAVAHDRDVSAAAWKGYINGVRARSGATTANEIRGVFRSRDVRANFNEMVGPFGLHADDYGDVLSAYVIALWMVANQAPVPNVVQVQTVNGQVHGQLARKPPTGSARQLQMQAEQMMYEVVATIHARQTAERSGNLRALADMAAVAQRSFLARGLDLQGMVLKERVGLVRR